MEAMNPFKKKILPHSGSRDSLYQSLEDVLRRRNYKNNTDKFIDKQYEWSGDLRGSEKKVQPEKSVKKWDGLGVIQEGE